MRSPSRLSMFAIGVCAAAAGFVSGWMSKPEIVARSIERDPSPDALSLPTAAVSPTGSPIGISRSGESPGSELASQPASGAGGVRMDSSSPPDVGAAVEVVLRSRLGGDPPADALERVRALRDILVAQSTGRATESVVNAEIARRETLKLEAAGEMPKFLEAMREKGASVAEVAADGARMRVLLVHPAKGPRVPSNDLKALSTPAVADGSALLLPEGRFEFPRVDTLAAGLTISGLGIDRTYLAGELHPSKGSTIALTVEDLTLTGQDVFDSSAVLTLTLRRVRAAGYNSGAGGSSFLDVRSGDLAILCEDCVFDGIVGSAGREKGPERHGTPFSLSANAKLLRFERCTFLGNAEIVQTWGSATIHFDHCTFRGNAKARVSGAVYVDCVFADNGDDARR